MNGHPESEGVKPDPNRPTLLAAMLFGSLRCLLTGVISPTAIAFALALSATGNWRAEAVWLLPLLVLLVSGILFTIHEAILIALTLFLRKRFHRMTAISVKSVLFQSVACTDIALFGAAFVFVGPNETGQLIWLALLMAAGIYGATMYIKAILGAVDVAPPSETFV